MVQESEVQEESGGREEMFEAPRIREWAASYDGDVNARKGYEEFGKHKYCVAWFHGNKTVIQQILKAFDEWAESYPDVAKDLTLTRGNCHKPLQGWGKNCVANYNQYSNTIEFDNEYCERPRLWKKFGGVEAGVPGAVATVFELAIKAYNSELEPTWVGVMGGEEC